jgi:hypothetical protein
LAYEIITGKKKGKKVVEQLFSDRKKAFKTIRELQKTGICLPLYTKRTKKK